MHNALNCLSHRVVIDANVLMDAALVCDGAARRSLSDLHSLGYQPIIDRTIEAEAVARLREKGAEYCPGIDLRQVLIDSLRSFRVLSLDAAPSIPSRNVNASDTHILSAAAHYQAWVLTGDLALIVQLQQENIESRLPFDVIMEAAPNLLMGNMIRIVSPTRQRGMLFGRVIPGNWAGTTAGGKFTVCDMENVGRVYYDNDAGEWGFDMPIGESVKIRCQIQQRNNWAVCGSYELPGNGAAGTITIRAGTDPNNRESRTIGTTKEITSPTPGRSSHGSSISGTDIWGGPIRSIVIGPQGMGRKAFRNILTIPDAAPNPYDNGMLDRVLQRVGSLNPQPGTLIQLPTESDLKALNF